MKLPDALHSRINTDGERHPLENSLAFTSCALGLLSLLSLIPGWFDAAAYVALAGALVAGYDEFIAKTSGERWLILTGFTLSVVGLALGMANGAIF
ncbi:MAG: hypothetical protein ACRDPJ_09725 [Nocardioidaceae bacterium]